MNQITSAQCRDLRTASRRHIHAFLNGGVWRFEPGVRSSAPSRPPAVEAVAAAEKSGALPKQDAAEFPYKYLPI
jgi:hypothetical protein